MNQTDLNDIYIDALKDAYLTLRRRYDPSSYGIGKCFTPRLAPIADLLIQGKGDPYAYMQFVFDHFATKTCDVYPNMVMSPKLVTLFLEARKDCEEELKLILRLQSDYVTTHTKNGRPLEYILKDRLAPLSAVFRFALAWSSQLFDVAELFRLDATRMLMFEPLYKQLLFKWLPEDMKNV